jgi:hypothetical protein
MRMMIHEAAISERKPEKVAKARPIDCVRLRHTNVVGLALAKANSAGEHT